MDGQAYGPMDSMTRKVFKKSDERIGVAELKLELGDKLKGYSETMMRVLGGITLVSALLLFVTGIFIIQNRASMLPGPMLFAWNMPFIDYAESLYFWSANVMLLFSALILIRGCFYAIYKTHGEGIWIAELGMAGAPFVFILIVSAFMRNAESIHLLSVISGFFGLSWLLANPNASVFGVCGMLAVILAYLAFLIIYLRITKRYGSIPAPEYNFKVRARKKINDFGLGACTIFGTAFIAYAALGILSLASLAFRGIAGAYNTNTFIELWMVYPLRTMRQQFGDIGVFTGIFIPFIYLLLMSLLDRNLFTSWRRRKPGVFIGLALMAVYAALGFMAITPNVVVGSMQSIPAYAYPAFTYPEFPLIMASIIISVVAGVYMLERSIEK